MSFGRFKGGQHFSKKALKAENERISPEQVKQLKAFGLGEYNLDKLSYAQAAHLLKELKTNKEKTLQRIKTL